MASNDSRSDSLRLDQDRIARFQEFMVRLHVVLLPVPSPIPYILWQLEFTGAGQVA